MTGEQLIINFEDDKAFLTEERTLTLQQLHLPDIAKRFETPASWTIRVLKYNRDKKRIFAEILTYKKGKQLFPYHQLSPTSEINNIEEITFRSIDTDGLLRTLRDDNPRIYLPTAEKVPVKKERPQPPIIPKREPRKQTIKETFFIPLKDVRFRFGGVSVEKWITRINRNVEFVIPNDEIREEFDAIKNYFENVLRVKKIKCETIIQLTDEEITSVETKSPEISRIDQKLIECVKFEFVKDLTKKKIKIELDKSLFTMDEFFDTLTDEKVKANVFYDNEQQLIEDLLQITDTKHYKHLRFLSSKHAALILKLRFVIKPFSFIFLIEGEKKYHIIWETLDTAEATYIWHEDKDINKLKLALKKVDDIINVIKVQNKTAYLNTREENFERIYHDYSQVVNGFVKWKGELESVLV